MAKVNPPVRVTNEAIRVAEMIRANGGSLTAEEWQQTNDWEFHGTAPTRTGALRMAGPDGAIFGSPEKGWRVARRRTPNPSTCRACQSEATDEGCTNPFCPAWRYGEDFDEMTRQKIRAEKVGQ